MLKIIFRVNLYLAPIFILFATMVLSPSTAEAAFSAQKKIGGCTFYARIVNSAGVQFSTISKNTDFYIEVSWTPGTGDNSACDNFDSVEAGYYTSGNPLPLYPQDCNIPAPIVGNKRVVKMKYKTAQDTVISKYVMPQNGTVVCDLGQKKTESADKYLQLSGPISNSNSTVNTNTTSNSNTNTANGNSNTGGIPNNATDTSVSATLGSLDQSLGSFFNPLEKNTLPELMATLLRILFAIIGTLAVIIIIVAGFRMVLANGNEGELTKAKAAITWAVVGLILSLMAFSIVAIVQRLIQG